MRGLPAASLWRAGVGSTGPLEDSQQVAPSDSDSFQKRISRDSFFASLTRACHNRTLTMTAMSALPLWGGDARAIQHATTTPTIQGVAEGASGSHRAAMVHHKRAPQPHSHPRRHITEFFKGERGHPFRMFKTELKRVARNYLTDSISVYTRQPNRIAPPPAHMFGAPGKVRDGHIPAGQAAMGAPNKHTDTPPPAQYRRQPLAARAAGAERARTGTTESFFSFLV